MQATDGGWRAPAQQQHKLGLHRVNMEEHWATLKTMINTHYRRQVESKLVTSALSSLKLHCSAKEGLSPEAPAVLSLPL